MSVAPEQQEFGAKMLQTVLELARAAIATAQVDATKANILQQAAEDRVADLSGRLEREEAERRMLQQQKDNLQTEADKLREMLSAVRNKVNQAEGQGARAHAEAVAERARAADLRRQLEAFQAKKRRWWQF
jgi:chromosome segregation ATPase